MQHSFQKYTAQYPALIRLGVPITIGQLGTIVLGFADTLMIWPIEARSHRRSAEKWLGGWECAHAHPAGHYDHALP